MMSLDRILCPATLPFHFDDALRYAASLARVYKAKLVLLQCAAAPALVSFLADHPVDGQTKHLLADSLTQYRSDWFKPDWEVVVDNSGEDVGEEIVRTAREERIDLIVLPSQRPALATLLGFTAEQVCRSAPCAVLVIHSEESASSNGHFDLGRVLVGHDFSSSSELALSYALSIVQKYESELHLMHVLPDPQDEGPEVAWTRAGAETAYHRAVQRLQNSVNPEACKHCRVTHVVRWGKPYREVLAYAREQRINMLCMGALGRDFGREALFGSNVDRVLRQASCPVLIARPLRRSVSEPLLLASETLGERRSLGNDVILRGKRR